MTLLFIFQRQRHKHKFASVHEFSYLAPSPADTQLYNVEPGWGVSSVWINIHTAGPVTCMTLMYLASSFCTTQQVALTLAAAKAHPAMQ